MFVEEKGHQEAFVVKLGWPANPLPFLQHWPGDVEGKAGTSFFRDSVSPVPA